MPPCEMCGAEQPNLTLVSVSHAELEVCDGCSDIGTLLETDADDEETESSTKYSTSTDGDTVSSQDASGQPTGTELTSKLVQDYAKRIRKGRKQSQLTQEELAERLDEKESYLAKIERGEMQPDTTTQMQLEQFLNIDLSVPDED